MHGVSGAKLKKARTELGLSQGAVGRALGLSSEFISLLEADKRAPSLATLNKIASLLRKDIGYFLEEKEGAFNILLRGDALKGPKNESLDPASQPPLAELGAPPSPQLLSGTDLAYEKSGSIYVARIRKYSRCLDTYPSAFDFLEDLCYTSCPKTPEKGKFAAQSVPSKEMWRC